MKPTAPLTLAISLQRTYRALVAAWEKAAEEIVISKWESNPIAFGPGRSDAPWVNEKLRALQRTLDDMWRSGELEKQIRITGAKVSIKNSRQLQKLLPTVKLRDIGGFPEAIEGFRKRNIALIRSLQGRQLEEIRGILETAELQGLRVEVVRKQIIERFGVSRSKADLLARDQVLKLNGELTEKRQTQAGITRYRWSTSNDERVRESHEELDGEEISWDDPPETNADGDRNHPGGDYQCRCVAIPILDD